MPDWTGTQLNEVWLVVRLLQLVFLCFFCLWLVFFLSFFSEVIVDHVKVAFLNDADGECFLRSNDELGAFLGSQSDVVDVSIGVDRVAQVFEDLFARDLQKVADKSCVVDCLLVGPLLVVVAHGDAWSRAGYLRC